MLQVPARAEISRYLVQNLSSVGCLAKMHWLLSRGTCLHWCGLVLLCGMSGRKVSAGVVILPCGGADHSSDAPASFNLS